MTATRFSAALLLAGLAAIAAAQDKKILTHADYDNWNKSSGVALSPDGRYVAHIITPLDGRDGQAIVRVVATGKDITLPRGGINSTASGSPQFSPDSSRVVIPLSPTRAEIDQAKSAKTAPEKMPRPMLAIVSLPGGEVTARLPYAKNFTVNGDGAGFLLYQKPAPGEPKEEKKEEPKKTFGKKAPEVPAPRASRGSGSALFIRNLATGAERTIADVGEYELSRDGKLLVYTVDSKDESKNGVFAIAPQAEGEPETLKSGEGQNSRLTWDQKQKRLAFFYDSAGVNTNPNVAPPPRPKGAPTGAAPSTLPPKWHVFVWDRDGKEAIEVMTPATKGLKPGTQLNGTTLGFNLDGTRLHLATTVVRPPARPTFSTGDKVELDLWHWKDGHLQPAQKIRGDTERNRSFSAVLFLDTYEFRMVSDDSLTVGLPAVGDWALGQDDKNYLHLTGIIQPVPRDFTLVNIKTGEKKSILTATEGLTVLSTNGQYVLHFDGKDWNTIATASGTKTNLTSKLPVKFWNEDDDHPKQPPRTASAAGRPTASSCCFTTSSTCGRSRPTAPPLRTLRRSAASRISVSAWRTSARTTKSMRTNSAASTSRRRTCSPRATFARWTWVTIAWPPARSRSRSSPGRTVIS